MVKNDKAVSLLGHTWINGVYFHFKLFISIPFSKKLLKTVPVEGAAVFDRFKGLVHREKKNIFH